MSDEPKIAEQLSKLTIRQCQILSNVCMGLDYREISEKLNWSEVLIQKEMSAVYKIFALNKRDKFKRRAAIQGQVCPVLLARVSDPMTDCSKLGVIEAGPEPPVDEAMLALVVSDQQEGNIPFASTQSRSLGGYQGVGEYRGGYPPPPILHDPRPWILVGVLGTLLVVLLGAVGYLFVTTRNQPAIVLQVTAPPSVITVVVTQPPPIVTQLPKFVTQVAPTPIPPIVTPTPAVLNLAGQVPSEIPGYKLPMNVAVTSVVDKNTKYRDVYSLDLVVGSDITVRMAVPTFNIPDVYFMNPGSKSVETGQVSLAWKSNQATEWPEMSRGKLFTPAATGTYYLEIRAADTSQKYTLIYTR